MGKYDAFRSVELAVMYVVDGLHVAD